MWKQLLVEAPPSTAWPTQRTCLTFHLLLLLSGSIPGSKELKWFTTTLSGVWGIIFSSEKSFSPTVNEIIFCTFSYFGSRSSWVMSHLTVGLTPLIQRHGNKSMLFCIILQKSFVVLFVCSFFPWRDVYYNFCISYSF